MAIPTKPRPSSPPPNRLRKESGLYLILGGAAVCRCDRRVVFGAGYKSVENSVSYQGIRFGDALSLPKSVALSGAGRIHLIFRTYEK